MLPRVGFAVLTAGASVAGTSVEATSIAVSSVAIGSVVVDLSSDPHAARVMSRAEMNRDGLMKNFFDMVSRIANDRAIKTVVTCTPTYS
jgi:Ethanolamine utilization protein EutJ (predicted chaperonin)